MTIVEGRKKNAEALGQKSWKEKKGAVGSRVERRRRGERSSGPEELQRMDCKEPKPNELQLRL